MWMNRVILRKFKFLAMFVNFSKFFFVSMVQKFTQKKKMLDVTSWKEINK